MGGCVAIWSLRTYTHTFSAPLFQKRNDPISTHKPSLQIFVFLSEFVEHQHHHRIAYVWFHSYADQPVRERQTCNSTFHNQKHNFLSSVPMCLSDRESWCALTYFELSESVLLSLDEACTAPSNEDKNCEFFRDVWKAILLWLMSCSLEEIWGMS